MSDTIRALARRATRQHFDENPHQTTIRGLQRRHARQFRDYAAASLAAEDAPYGSIAHANDPNRYGSVASSRFPDVFGPGRQRPDPAPAPAASAPAARPAAPAPLVGADAIRQNAAALGLSVMGRSGRMLSPSQAQAEYSYQPESLGVLRRRSGHYGR